MVNRQTKYTAIPKEVKKVVGGRDGHCCIFCGSPYARPEAHYIPRSQGGMGIEENILTVCRFCHEQLDEGKKWQFLHNFAKAYLMDHYPDWDESKLVYHKNHDR